MQVNFTIPWLTRRRLLGIIAPLVVIPVVIATSASSCGGGGNVAAQQENDASANIWNHYNSVQPLYQPTGDSVYRDTLTWTEAQHVLGLNTYTFVLRHGGNGGPIFECPSEGAAVPASAQLSNPQFVESDPNNGSSNPGSVIVGNMDPDGVYPPPTTLGTNVRCILGNGKPFLVYSEPDVIQFGAPLVKWDPSLYNGQGGFVIPGGVVTAQPICQVRYTTVSAPAGAPSASPDTQQTVAVTNCKAAKGSTPHN